MNLLNHAPTSLQVVDKLGQVASDLIGHIEVQVFHHLVKKEYFNKANKRNETHYLEASREDAQDCEFRSFQDKTKK